MKISNTLRRFLKGLFFASVVASVYCGAFIMIAQQSGLIQEQYALWMAISAGVIVPLLNSLFKRKRWLQWLTY